MSHLLTLSIGPVQDFIAAARRTRDLWFGSLLLSEVSKAAARKVRGLGGGLIFPADVPDDEEDSIANVILAELKPEIDPAHVAAEAKAAALACWVSHADEVHGRFGRVIRDDVWREQVKGVIECHAAWVSFKPEDYKQQRRRLADLLAGRKNCRDFEQGVHHPGVPKSSLDGLRETVLREGTRDGWRGLRVRKGEQLDAVGLVKRQGGGSRPYPSVSRVAADPWLRGLGECGELADLRAACESLGPDVVHPIDTDTRRLHPDYQRFPFEGTAVYRNRHDEMAEEAGGVEVDLAGLRAALKGVEAAAGREPDPYLAVLVADGDKMGEAIGNCKDADAHRHLSRRLAGFANEAGKIVKDHHGVLIYAGGDDVLAFLPLDKALHCARRLHDDFGERMGPSTLSVGIAIGHYYEDLEDLLQYGRRAEKHAKGRPDERDGLAVHLHKRGGSPVEVRRQWSDDLDLRLIEYAGWFIHRAVSGRTPYELHRLADEYEGWPADTVCEAIQRDAFRLIDKKKPGGVDDHMHRVRQRIEDRVHDPDDLRLLARELLVARQLAVAMRQAGHGRAS